MASHSSEKKLWEHLQEPQKPFLLDVYLLERKTKLNKNQQRALRSGLSKRTTWPTSKFLKVIVHKFVHGNRSRQTAMCCEADEHQLVPLKSKKLQHKEWRQEFWTVKNSVELDDSSQCRVAASPPYEHAALFHARISATMKNGSLKKQEIVPGEVSLHCVSKEDDNQHSPESVLDGVLPTEKGQAANPFLEDDNEGAPTSVNPVTKDADSKFSSLLLDLLIDSATEDQSCPDFKEAIEEICSKFPHWQKNKKMLQQSKRLLLDCMEEVLHEHQKHRGKKFHQEFISIEAFGKIIHEQICSWEQKTSDEQMICYDSGTTEEWDYFEQISEQVAVEIGDEIMAEMIQEVIGSFCKSTTAYKIYPTNVIGRFNIKLEKNTTKQTLAKVLLLA